MKRIILLLVVLLLAIGTNSADAAPCQDTVHSVSANAYRLETWQRTPCGVTVALEGGIYRLDSKRLLMIEPIRGCIIRRGTDFTPSVQGGVVTAVIIATDRCAFRVTLNSQREGKRWLLRLTRVGWPE